jgi:hypothetical protein
MGGSSTRAPRRAHRGDRSLELAFRSPCLEVTGTYAQEELAPLVEKHGVNMFFFPSIWPRRSPTSSRMAALGLPIVAFDLGAPAERLRALPLARLVSRVDAGPRWIPRGFPSQPRPAARRPHDHAAARLHVFTSAAVNYLPKVRTLCRSIREHHPEAVIHFALADERPPGSSRGRALRRRDRGRRARDPELALVDFQARHRRALDRDQALRPAASPRAAGLPYRALLRPDMVLFSRVDDILAALELPTSR